MNGVVVLLGAFQAAGTEGKYTFRATSFAAYTFASQTWTGSGTIVPPYQVAYWYVSDSRPVWHLEARPAWLVPDERPVYVVLK